MKIYWSTKRIPELAGLSVSERKKVLRECHFRDLTMLFLFCILLWLSADMATWFADRMHLGWFGGLICHLGGGAAAGVSVCNIQLTRIRPRIRQYLELHTDELKTI